MILDTKLQIQEGQRVSVRSIPFPTPKTNYTKAY